MKWVTGFVRNEGYYEVRSVEEKEANKLGMFVYDIPDSEYPENFDSKQKRPFGKIDTIMIDIAHGEEEVIGYFNKSLIEEIQKKGRATFPGGIC